MAAAISIWSAYGQRWPKRIVTRWKGSTGAGKIWPHAKLRLGQPSALRSIHLMNQKLLLSNRILLAASAERGQPFLARTRAFARAFKTVDENSAVSVDQTPHGRAVIATRPFTTGDAVLHLEGVILTSPSRYTLQVGCTEHLAPTPGNPDPPWVCMNHSFTPTVHLQLRSSVGGGVHAVAVAIADIAEGDEIVFDYTFTEWELAEPFQCVHTGRVVEGFKALSLDERKERLHLAFPHIRQMHEKEMQATCND
eukprot:6190583-Pleurochrysis_carterae.AAC.3